MSEKLLSISEAAKLLDVCENTLRDWDIEGKFKAERSVGGHRRYSLDQVREYLEKNPPKEEKLKTTSELGKIDKILDNWYDTEYLSDLTRLKDLGNGKAEFSLPKDELKVLAVLLENAKLHNEGTYNPLFSTTQVLWLTKQAWLRSKLRKTINIQPLLGPAGLVYYLKDNKDHLIVESEAVAAKTLKYHFTFFRKADFNNVKEVYADALAYEIDMLIADMLPKINIENVLDASLSTAVNLRDMYDYVVAPIECLDKLRDRSAVSGVDLFEGPVHLDPNSFIPSVVGGRYPTSKLSAPTFAPYILIAETPIHGSVCSAIGRFGFFSGVK